MTAGCYTVAQLLVRLDMRRRTFYELHKAGRLPFLEELRPRLGRCQRFRADLVDRYLAGQWGSRDALHRVHTVPVKASLVSGDRKAASRC
jgi:hypothetical protein